MREELVQPKRVIRLYYGFQFFFSLLLWLPVFYEYQRRVGLSDGAIFSIQSLYYLAFCLLEIPTGLFADRFGRRLCMRAGAVIVTLSNLLPILAPSYLGFACEFLCVALARSLISGASSAYLYDWLQERGLGSHYRQIEGNARAYGLIGKVLLWPAIGALMEWKLSLPYALTAGLTGVSILFAWALPAERGAFKPAQSRGLPDPRPVLAILGRSPLLVFLMLQGISVFVLARICQVNLFQPILGAKHFGLGSYGVILSITTIFEAIGSARPGVLRRRLSDLNSVFLLGALMAVSLAGVAISGKFGTVAWLCVFSLATGFSFPIQRQVMNDSIGNPAFRATLLSIESILDRAACAWVAASVGAFVAGGRTMFFLQLASAVSLVGIGLLVLAFRFLPGRIWGVNASCQAVQG